MAQKIIIRSESEVIELENKVRTHVAELVRRIRSCDSDDLRLFAEIRFGTIGKHPVTGDDLNAVEQINQTFTYLVALAATRSLLGWYPQPDGYSLAPGAHMAQALDIMSVNNDSVGAEVFAAVHPSNNQKLKKDIEKLQARRELKRYVFFSSPSHDVRKPTRYRKLERCDSVQVWAVPVGLSAREFPED